MKEIGIFDQFLGFLETVDICKLFPQEGIQTFDLPAIDITTNLLADLQNLDHPRNSVLGKRMESFLEIAIKHCNRYDLIDANVQIIQDKQTLGELDFLVYDLQDSKPVHVEMVYKLYIHANNYTDETKNWIGPNRRDSFFQKLKKLKSRQFPLLYKPETWEYLKEIGYSINDFEQRLCFKAQLYVPENMKPTRGNSEYITGKWLKFQEFQSKDWKNNKFYSPRKKYWSCMPENNEYWINYSDLLVQLELFLKAEKAPMVWMKSDYGFDRFFIVWW